MNRAKLIATLQLLILPVVLIGVVIFVLANGSPAPLSVTEQPPVTYAPLSLPAAPG